MLSTTQRGFSLHTGLAWTTHRTSLLRKKGETGSSQKSFEFCNTANKTQVRKTWVSISDPTGWYSRRSQVELGKGEWELSNTETPSYPQKQLDSVGFPLIQRSPASSRLHLSQKLSGCNSEKHGTLLL